MLSSPKRRKINFSPESVAFAEEMVNRAGIIDDDTANLLVRAIAAVPREKFFDDHQLVDSRDDVSLPIGYGQFSLRPSLAIRMLGLIGLKPGLKVLQIGTGNGYMAAVMASAGAYVFGMESVGILAQKSRKRLDALYLQNIIVRAGDGKKGWLEHTPYESILITAPFESIEPEVFRQLVKPGGRLVAVVGKPNDQRLCLWETKYGRIEQYQLESCQLVSN